MQAFSYQPNIKAGLCSYFCGSVTFLVCKTTICLRSQDVVVSQENYSKNICKDKIMGGGAFYLNLLLEGKFTQAPHIPGRA